MSDAARGLERAGTGAIVLATNTMHKVADAIEQAVEIPLLHIGDAVGEALQAGGFQRVALLGTRFTMQQDFYRLRLAERYGIKVVLPEETQMAEIDRIIFSELCQGQFTSVSRAYYLACLESLHGQGAQAAILGCTEIGLLLQGVEAPLPLIDSTQVHVQSGLRWLLGRSGESDWAKT
ncbi:amino acid racemase [Pseudomonas coleopterorum]|uniref:aspartate/glutamate racemase family protein n=1 Tax=Pseudomonas coleopterorum TaxID=1605838 RepID=UPI002A6B75EC|nr:amino acid racemase [Pseudomonas coleopterorum]MDY1046779.1 amino acid racemase [Pseudomonas coleopterorum]